MPKQVYEVPLPFYLSDDLKAKSERKIDALKVNVNLALHSGRMIYTPLDLCGIRSRPADESKSLLSASYRPRPRFCDSLE